MLLDANSAVTMLKSKSILYCHSTRW